MKDRIIRLLESTNREGIKKLISYMDDIGFFDAPASIRYHGAFDGGLIYHCMTIYNLFKSLVNKYNLEFSSDSIIICSFLHDICKADKYEKVGKWVVNPNHKAGHAYLSLNMINDFIELTDIETTIIKYHMGMYATIEFDANNGEYPISELVGAYNKYPIAKLFYFCDDTSAQFIEYKE